MDKKNWVIAIGFGILLIIPFFIPVDYIIYLIFLIFINATLAVSWNVIGGYAGQISLGNAAFFGIGTYATAILWKAGLTPYLGMIMGGVFAMGLALIITPAFRLRGVYFAISTLIFNEIIRVWMINWTDVTGGASGIILPLPSNYSILPYYFLGLFLMLACIIFAYKLSVSKTGLAFITIREDEDASRSLGVNIFKYKTLALLFSAFFFGVAGGLHVSYLFIAEPHSVFSITWSVAPVFMVIVGGVGTIAGPIIGAIIYSLLSEVLVGIGEIHLVVFGSLLILVILFAPGGIYRLITKKILKIGLT
jgi:branched-chain amino acid transport system permease protein